MDNNHFKNVRAECKGFNTRILLSGFVVLALMGVLVWRLYFLQVTQHDHFTTQAQDNRVKLVPLPPVRGFIYDRNGVVLADNKPSFNLEMVPEKVGKGQIEPTLEALSKVLPISEKDRERFYRLKGQKRRFESIPIKIGLSEQEVASFVVSQHRFPGVSIQAGLARVYPFAALTGHALGYVGRISLEDIKNIQESEYAGSTHIGKTGVEKSYETLLHGHVGLQKVEVNALGKPVSVLEENPPDSGRSLRLHLDIKLQQVAWDSFGEDNGAAVAIDVQTGGVLALVSKPGYDPNLFVEGISVQEYRALQDDDNRPLYDRALRGQYPPGSTVKPFVGLAGLESQTIAIDTEHYCVGFFRLPNFEHKYRDWKKGGHGATDMTKAIVQSCDTYFYKLANDMGIDALQKYLANFHFGEKTGIDLVGELPGVRPSRQWKKDRFNQVWYQGETVIMGIGQGYFLATPLQMAAATAAIANGGRFREPRLVDRIINEELDTSTSVEAPTVQIPIRFEKNWQHIRNAMYEVVQGERGTAKSVRTDRYTIAGKTGTAQVFTVGQSEEYDEDKVEKKKRDHAWFIAYAPAENPRIAVAVIVENGGHGGSAAAPVVRRIMDQYLLGDEQ